MRTGWSRNSYCGFRERINVGPQDEPRECDRKNGFPVVDIFSDVNPLFQGDGGLEPPRAHFLYNVMYCTGIEIQYIVIIWIQRSYDYEKKRQNMTYEIHELITISDKKTLLYQKICLTKSK